MLNKLIGIVRTYPSQKFQNDVTLTEPVRCAVVTKLCHTYFDLVKHRVISVAYRRQRELSEESYAIVFAVLELCLQKFLNHRRLNRRDGVCKANLYGLLSDGLSFTILEKIG